MPSITNRDRVCQLSSYIKSNTFAYQQTNMRRGWFKYVVNHILETSQHTLLSAKNVTIATPEDVRPPIDLAGRNYTKCINPYAIGLFHIAELIMHTSGKSLSEGRSGKVMFDLDMDPIIGRLDGWKNPSDNEPLRGMIYTAESNVHPDIIKKLNDKGALQIGNERRVSLTGVNIRRNYEKALDDRYATGAQFLVARYFVYFACNDAQDCYTAQRLAARYGLHTFSSFEPIPPPGKGDRRPRSFTISARHFIDINDIGNCFDQERNKSFRSSDSNLAKILLYLPGEVKDLDITLCRIAAELRRMYESNTCSITVRFKETEKEFDLETILAKIEECDYPEVQLRELTETPVPKVEEMDASKSDPTKLRELHLKKFDPRKRHMVDKQYNFAIAPCHWIKPNPEMSATSYTIPLKFSSYPRHVELLSYDYGQTLIGFGLRFLNAKSQVSIEESNPPPQTNEPLKKGSKSKRAPKSSVKKSDTPPQTNQSLAKDAKSTPEPTSSAEASSSKLLGKPPRYLRQRQLVDYRTYMKRLDEKLIKISEESNSQMLSASPPKSENIEKQASPRYLQQYSTSTPTKSNTIEKKSSPNILNLNTPAKEGTSPAKSSDGEGSWKSANRTRHQKNKKQNTPKKQKKHDHK